jgi:dihydroflavonol-4-reductase
VAEHEVLRAGAEGLPVVLVQPTTPVGPRDRGPTPTGRTVLEILNGRFPGYVDTTLNIVDVEDVAHGHVLAAERGTVGRSYILGGENLTLRQVLAGPGRRHRGHRRRPGSSPAASPWWPPTCPA